MPTKRDDIRKDTIIEGPFWSEPVRIIASKEARFVNLKGGDNLWYHKDSI